jgi:ABC-2 type transport system ATP-binding protein
MTAPPPLLLDQVSKSLAGHEVLRDISFECPAGTITALLGPNGAGKTTTVTIATGLRRPSRGTVRVFGGDVGESRTRQHLSLVPQEIGFPDAVNVGLCLDFVAGQRVESRLAPSRAELCERLGIGDLLRRRAGALSGGQKRRLAVALGLIRAPGLLIMDEATTNLDEATRAITWQLVRDYVTRGGAALVTTHILADIESHADRVVALNNGQLVLHSPLAEVRTLLGGGSTVSIELPVTAQRAVLDAIATRGLGLEVPARTGMVQWRTCAPVALVAAVADLAPGASNLVVRPTPLSDLLDAVATTPAVAQPAARACS